MSLNIAVTDSVLETTARAAPKNLRLLDKALLNLPWPQAAFLAVVDSVSPTSYVTDRFVAEVVKMKRARAHDAGAALLTAGILSVRYERKRSASGRWFNAPFYTVNAEWTSRPGKRLDKEHFICLDQRFLNTHPRLGDDTKTLYHFLALEQIKYGGSALLPAQIAINLNITANATHTAAQRVSRSISKLVKLGEAFRHGKGVVSVPFNAHGQANLDRLDVGRRRRAATLEARPNVPLGATGNAPLGATGEKPHWEPPPELLERTVEALDFPSTVGFLSRARANAPTQGQSPAEAKTYKDEGQGQEQGHESSEAPDPQSGTTVRVGQSKDAARRRHSFGTDRPFANGFGGRFTMSGAYDRVSFTYQGEGQDLDDLLALQEKLEQSTNKDIAGDAQATLSDFCFDQNDNATAEKLLSTLGLRFPNLDPRPGLPSEVERLLDCLVLETTEAGLKILGKLRFELKKWNWPAPLEAIAA